MLKSSFYTCTKNPCISHDVRFLRYGVRQIQFLVIWGHFLPYYNPSPSPNNPENQNFEKMKKIKKRYYPFTHA